MTGGFASLPMYDWPEIRGDTDRLWSAIAIRFREAGINAPERLTRDCGGVVHWLDPDLLFSQTCGYPFATQLTGKVDLLGSPVYVVEGCYGSNYASAVVVRADDAVSGLKDAAVHRFAYNGVDSLSGFRCLVPLIGDPLAHFNHSVESGSHRASAQMVAQGEADIAAIDAVCWHLLLEVEPETAGKLRVLQWGPLYPALPFITKPGREETELDAMKRALKRAVTDVRGELSQLQLTGVEKVPAKAYAPLGLL